MNISTTAHQADNATQTTVQVSGEEMRHILYRAVNTLEPHSFPDWLRTLVGGRTSDGQSQQGILPGDTITIIVNRQST